MVDGRAGTTSPAGQVPAAPGSGPRRRRPALLSAGVAALLVVLLAAGGWFWWRERDQGTGQAQAERAEAGLRLPPPRAPARIGVFRGTDPGEVKRFEAWAGRPVDYVIDYSTRSSWADIADPELLIDAWRGTGYRVVQGLAMLPMDDDSATIENGAGGEYDHYFRDLARNLVNGGQADAVLRVGWEFNLGGSRWGTDDPTAWVAYYRNIVGSMRSVPGQRFQFDWNVNNGNNPVDAVDYYPGDDVVDYVGIDAYDQSWTSGTYPYPSGCDQACRVTRQDRAWFRDILGGSRGLMFWAKFAADHGRPVSLPEWGLWERPDGHGGGDDPGYIRRMHDFITGHDVAYAAYFEYSAEDGTHMLSDGTFPQSAAVYRQLFGAGG